MSSSDLLNFLLNEQRESVTAGDAHKLIDKYEVDETGRVNGKQDLWSHCLGHIDIMFPPSSQQSRRST